MEDSTRKIKIFENQPYFEEVHRLLLSGKEVKIPVRGNSMRPFLMESDLVVITRFVESEIHLGDILLVLFEGNYILHRFVKRRGEWLILAGDGNLQQLEYVKFSSVLGLAKYKIKGDQSININSKRSQLFGRIWFYCRPLRLLIIRFKKIWKKL